MQPRINAEKWRYSILLHFAVLYTPEISDYLFTTTLLLRHIGQNQYRIWLNGGEQGVFNAL